jgi:hypothetical protein
MSAGFWVEFPPTYSPLKARIWMNLKTTMKIMNPKPRAIKRRPKPYSLLTMPRKKAFREISYNCTRSQAGAWEPEDFLYVSIVLFK